MSDEHVTLPDEDPRPDAPPSVPGDTGTAAAAQPDPIRPVCAECGTSVEINQQYCLACGAPTAFAVPLRARKSTPALIAASLLALGIGGASMIYAATKEDTKQTSVASVPTDGTSPTIQTFPTFPTGTNPFPTGTGTTVPTFSTFTTATTYTANTTFTTTYTTTVTRTTGRTSPTTNYDDSDDWPYQNETRYTLVMRNYESLLDAQDYCDTLRGNNFSCGIINSDFYGSLNPGWFVVFHSSYTTKAKADAALASIKATYPAAYVRKIEV